MGIIPITVIAVLAGFFLERFVSSRWISGYYRTGVPIYRKRMRCEKNVLPGGSSVHAYAGKLEIKKTEPSTYYFRLGRFQEVGAQMYEFSPYHGVIHLSEGPGNCYVVCFINWHLVAIIALLVEIRLLGPEGNYLSIAGIIAISVSLLLSFARFKSRLGQIVS